jgi:hypothetical protein
MAQSKKKVRTETSVGFARAQITGRTSAKNSRRWQLMSDSRLQEKIMCASAA